MKRIIYTLVGMMLCVGAWAQTSLQDQINSATEATTIQLTENVDLGATSLIIPAGKNITLDLSGYSITSSASGAVAVKNNGVLTIKDTSEGQAGKIISTKHAGIGAGDNSITTFDSGNIESVEGAIVTGKIVGATITINGGTLSASDNAVVMGNGSSREGDANIITINGGTFNGQIKSAGYVACGIYAPWKDVITVNGGTFNITGGCGICARAGSVTVNGGVFNCTGTATGKVGDSRVVVPCSAIVYDSQANYPAQTTESKVVVPSKSTATFKSENGVAAVSVVGDSHIEISGGSYSSPLTEDVCAEGYIPSNTPNADGTYGAQEGSYVAQIGDKKYATLADAIAAVTDGVETTITLLANTTENVTIPAGKNIILDLGEKTLNGKQTASTPTIKNQGTLTLKNGNVRRTGEGSESYYVIENEGTITMDEGLNVEGSANSSLIHNIAATAQMTFNAGTYTQTGAFIVVKNDLGNVVVNGGTFTTASDKNVLNNWDQMTINGGTFTGNIFNGAYDTDNNTLTINNGTFNTNQIRTYLGNGRTTCPIEIKGGTFTNAGMKYVGTGNKETDTDVQVVVSGGTFANPVPKKYCANGFVPTKNADGTYGVEEGEYVAQVGEMQYTSLAVAVAEAEEGATVTLLTNVTLAQRIEPGKNMTIDLNGKKVITTATCGNGSAFDVKGGEVIIKNGTIDGTQVTETECDAITARSGANVTLQDLNITVDSKNGACAYAFDGAKITIESGYYENKTTETYEYNANITAMVVNQANVTTQLVEIKGGTFKGYDPAMGDDSQLSNENHTFLAPGFYTEKNADGTYGLMDEYTVNDGIAFKSLVKPAIVKTATYSRTMPMETTWGTVCLPFSLKQGDGNTTPKLYTFESISAETLTVTEVEDEVAPGTAVIFSYSGSDKAVFATTDAKVNTTVVPSSETLVGTFEDQTITEGLGNIYFINGDKFHQAKVSLTVPAYRAYISYAGSVNGAKPSVLNINIADSDNDIDGIAGVTLDELNSTEAIYDANGCKLSAPQKGLNIMKLASGKTVKLIVK